MKTKDLIKMLQVLVIDHQACGAEASFGDHEVYMDVYDLEKKEYLGVTSGICIEYSADGVFPILTAKDIHEL
jgi:hypothetical protein